MSRQLRVAWAFSIMVLLATSAVGFLNGPGDLRTSMTTLQRAVSAGVIVYAAFGALAGVLLSMRKRMAAWLAGVWAVAITFVASCAAVAWSGDTASWPGAMSSGIVAALLGAGVVKVALRSSQSDLEVSNPSR